MGAGKKYHKVTHEEHLTILASRNSVCSVPYEKISEKLGIPVRTVRRYAKIQPGKMKFRRHRTSMFDLHKDEIEALLNKDMGKQSHNVKTAMSEFRSLHPDLEFKKTAFYDFVRNKCNLTRELKLARIPLEHDYGEAQIDFCAVTYYRGIRRVNGHQFTMTFPRSGVSFVQCFPAENRQCLFEAMKSIFEYIGFVPQSVLFDNAATAVLITKGKGRDAVATREYADFAAYYGFETRFCSPASGWEKGAVERGGGVKRKAYFTPPPRIRDEREFNRELLKRCLEDTKNKHYLKGVSKSELFEKECKAGLPLPETPFDCYQTEVRKTDKCALVQLNKCRYSVSDRHPRKQVIIRYSAFDIDIYEMTGELICRHRRSYKDGSTTIDPKMYADALAARPRARIKKSDNEYTCEIWTNLNKAIASVRPAARDDALVQLCERQGVACLPIATKTKQSVLLYGLAPYSMDKEHYDRTIQSNSIMVQTAEAGRAVCRSCIE